MDLNEVEGTVKDAIHRAGEFFMQVTRNDGYLNILIGLVPPDGSHSGAPHARIWTSGTGAFFIDLPGGFRHQEFDYEREGQVAVLRLLVTVANEYLLGHFEEKEQLRSFGRRRRYLQITAEGEDYRLYRR